MSAEAELRKALAEAQVGHWRRTNEFLCACGADTTAGFHRHLADVLLPIVTAWAKQRAAAELESAAAVHWADKVRWAEVRLDLRARAAALAAGQRPR